MKIHPLPKKRTAAEAILSRQKKLRRLPHIFSKVLELPFGSDAHVLVAEDPDCFRFAAAAAAVACFDGGVRAQAIEIYPGVMKVVIREAGMGGGDDVRVEDMEIDRWRFRLPPETRPALATAEMVGGELLVVVPKGMEEDCEEEIGDFNRIVVVQ